MEQTKAAPYKVDTKTPKFKYEVLKNGDLKIEQVVESKTYFKTREFITLMRQHTEALKDTDYNLSKEFKDAMLKQKKELLTEIDKLKPLLQESEEKAQESYNKMIHDGLLKKLRENLSKEELDMKWFENIWFKTKLELKANIVAELTEGEIDKLNEIPEKIEKNK